MPGLPNRPPSVQEISNMREAILLIAKDCKQQYPIISEELARLRQHLFYNNGMGVWFINSCVLGQIVEALSILDKV